MSAMPVRAPRRKYDHHVAAAPTQAPKPTLHVVQAPQPRKRNRGFLLLAFSIIAGALLGALALNTVMATTAYEIAEQQTSLARLVEHEQALSYEIDTLRAPANIIETAVGMGMVPAEGMNYLNLEENLIVGPNTPDQE